MNTLRKLYQNQYSYNENINITGALIRKVMNDMLNKTSKNPAPTDLFLYSGHEMIIVAVLQTLKIWKPAFIPQYSCGIILELREDGGHFFVKVQHRENV